MKTTNGSEAETGFPLSSRKVAERALILPLIGLVLLIPPIAGIFEIDARVFGIPFTILYLFGVWAMLIILANRLSRRLQSAEDHETERETLPENSGESAQ